MIHIQPSLFYRLNDIDISAYDCITNRITYIINNNNNELDKMHNLGQSCDIQDIKTNIRDKEFVIHALEFYQRKILHYETRLLSINIDIINDKALQITGILKNNENFEMQFEL